MTEHTEHFDRRGTAIVLLASVFLVFLGQGLNSTLIAVRAGLEGFSDWQIGLVTAAFFAGFVVGPPAAAQFAHQVGLVRTFSAFASIASAAPLLHLLLISPLAWVVVRFLYGFVYGGLLIVVEGWLNAVTPPEKRGMVLSLYTLVYLLGFAGGQGVFALFPADSFHLFVVVAIVLSIALVPLSLAQVHHAKVVPPTPMGLVILFQRAPVGLTGVIASGLGVSVFWGLGARYAQLIGLSEVGISQFIAVAISGGLVLQWPLGRLSDRIDRRRVMFGASVVAGIAAFGLGLAGHLSPVVLFPLAIVFGAFALPLYSLSIAHTNDMTPPSRSVDTAGTLVRVYGLSSTISPLLAGALMEMGGAGAAFEFAAAVLIAHAVFTSTQLKSRRMPPLRKRRFNPVPRGTVGIAAMVKRPRSIARKNSVANTRDHHGLRSQNDTFPAN